MPPVAPDPAPEPRLVLRAKTQEKRAFAPLRPSFTLGDTTFHFIDAPPAEALERAKAAADGKDVRIGGGTHTLRAFLDSDLVDTDARRRRAAATHPWRAPVGKPDELLDRFHLDTVPSSSGVTHLLFWRR